MVAVFVEAPDVRRVDVLKQVRELLVIADGRVAMIAAPTAFKTLVTTVSPHALKDTLMRRGQRLVPPASCGGVVYGVLVQSPVLVTSTGAARLRRPHSHLCTQQLNIT